MSRRPRSLHSTSLRMTIGLHEPEASHLYLPSAFLPPEQIRAAYEQAVAERYLWHEFGDLNLIL
jgi:S-adenosylmethionine:tRNA ribosyltransferase-isomerase